MEQPILEFPKIPFIDLVVLASPSTLLYVLAVFGFLYFVITCVLFYHWTSYGMGNHGIYVAEILFITVSALFFLVAFLSASYF